MIYARTIVKVKSKNAFSNEINYSETTEGHSAFYLQVSTKHLCHLQFYSSLMSKLFGEPEGDWAWSTLTAKYNDHSGKFLLKEDDKTRSSRQRIKLLFFYYSTKLDGKK